MNPVTLSERSIGRLCKPGPWRLMVIEDPDLEREILWADEGWLLNAVPEIMNCDLPICFFPEWEWFKQRKETNPTGLRRWLRERSAAVRRERKWRTNDPFRVERASLLYERNWAEP